MELKDFIKETIAAISNGIIEAQKELEGKDVFVNPEKLEIGKDDKPLMRSDGWRYVQQLDFEINVSVEEKSQVGGGGSVKVLGIASIGANGGTEASTSNSNKLKFTLPVAFPTTKTPDVYKPKKAVYTGGAR